MELESLVTNIETLSNYITSQMDGLSASELDAICNDHGKLVAFARQHLYSDILANNLKQSIIDEVEFYERKAFLIRIDTFIIRLLSKKFSERLASLKD